MCDRLVTGFGWTGLLATTAGLGLRQFVILWRPVVLLTSFASVLLFLAPVALVVFAAYRRRLPAAIATLLTAGAVWTLAPLYVSSGPSVNGPQLTVLQFNEHSHDVTAPTIAEQLRRRHVDVLALEELDTEVRGQLAAAGVDAELPYHYYPTQGRSRIGPVGLWSRYPLSDTRDLTDITRGGISATVAVPGTSGVAFAVVHLASPAVDSIPHWNADLRRVLDLTSALVNGSRPVILAGDLNATLDHADLRKVLRHGFQDAVEQAGAGWLPTFPSITHYPPLLAIDHVILRDARASSALTVHMPGSLHRALIVRLRLAG